MCEFNPHLSPEILQSRDLYTRLSATAYQTRLMPVMTSYGASTRVIISPNEPSMGVEDGRELVED